MLREVFVHSKPALCGDDCPLAESRALHLSRVPRNCQHLCLCVTLSGKVRGSWTTLIDGHPCPLALRVTVSVNVALLSELFQTPGAEFTSSHEARRCEAKNMMSWQAVEGVSKGPKDGPMEFGLEHEAGV